MPDLDEGLAELARHAARTGRLEPAAALRRRADRRRHRRHAAAATAAVLAVVALGAGIAFAQPDGGRPPLPPAESPTPSISPSPSRTPAPSFAPSGAGEQQTGLSYQRAHRLVPAATPQPVSGLALGSGGRFEIPATGEGATFTLATVSEAPNRSEWLIRLDEEGGSRCLSIQPDRSVGLAKCAASHSDQRFELRLGPHDVTGRRIYGIVTREPATPGWLTWNPAGTPVTVTEDPGPADVRGWILYNEGPSTLAD
jgi:hypothetical protein